MIIPIELRFEADKDSKSAFRTDKTIKSHDVNSVEFHITVDGLELTDTHTAKILSVFHGSNRQVIVECEIVNWRIIYKPDTNLISRHEHVTNYVYVYNGNQSLDVCEFTYVVNLSKIDETSLEVKEVYDQSYADLLTDFEQALSDYKDTLPQADSVRAEVDEILNQVSSQAVADWKQDADALLETVEDNELARVDAEASRVEKESERLQAETERIQAEQARKEAELLREESYEQKVDTAIVEADVVEKVDNKVTELTPRMNDLTAQLAQNEREIGDVAIKTYSTTTKAERKPIVTIRFDDGYGQDWTVLKPIAEQYDFPVTIAYITGDENGSGKSSLTIEQMLALQNDLGWECSSHTLNTNDLPALSDEELDRQLRLSKELLVSQGLEVDTLIYPVGLSGTRVRQFTRKYYRAGLGTRAGVNRVPIDQYDTFGVHIHDYSLEQLKGRVDTAESNNGWLVLYGHSTALNLSEQQKLKDIVEYIQAKNIDIMTATNALDHFENTLEIENGGVGESFKIGADGVPYSRKIDEQNHIYKAAQFYDENWNLIRIDNDTPITFFDRRKVTSVSFGHNSFSGITNGVYVRMGGTLLTYRINDDDILNHQMFIPYSNVGLMVRYWTANGWGDWRQHMLLPSPTASHFRFNVDMNYKPASHAHSDYENGITVFDFNSSGASGYPTKAGTVITYKSRQGYHWSYQKVEGYQSANSWKRWGTGNNSWSEWAQL